MAKIFESIDDYLRNWIKQQRIFFVATAPLAADGHINCSPKGSDTFRVLSGNEVAYLDLTGSGIETVAHLRENGRIVIMFCAFSGPPKIIRLHGLGEALAEGTAEFDALRGQFAELPGARSIIRVKVNRIADSCGYAVPLHEFKSERDGLNKWAEKKGPDGVREYWTENNQTSIDGIPGIPLASNS